MTRWFGALLLVCALGAPAHAADVLTLEEALAAAGSQPQARIDEASARAALARANQARAALLPQVGLDAGWRLSTSNNAGSTPGITADPTLRSAWDVGLSASEVVWDGGVWASLRAGRANAEAAALEAKASTITLRQAVRVDYFTARAAKEAVGVARQAVTVQEAHLRAVEAYIEVGTRPPIDRAQARADLANAQVRLLQAENSARIARLRLDQSIGAATAGEVGDDDLGPAEHEDDPLDALLALARTARPDVQAVQAQLAAARASVDGDRAGRLPTVGAFASVTMDGSRLDAAALNGAGGINVGWTLYGGGAVAARVAESEAGVDAAEAQADALDLAVRVEVGQAEADVQSAKAVLAAAGEALAASKERLDLAEGRYATGVGSALELEDAQLAYAEAGLQAVQARYALSTARADWLAAMGIE